MYIKLVEGDSLMEEEREGGGRGGGGTTKGYNRYRHPIQSGRVWSSPAQSGLSPLPTMGTSARTHTRMHVRTTHTTHSTSLSRAPTNRYNAMLAHHSLPYITQIYSNTFDPPYSILNISSKYFQKGHISKNRFHTTYSINQICV
jgi:hypothetical protein